MAHDARALLARIRASLIGHLRAYLRCVFAALFMMGCADAPREDEPPASNSQSTTAPAVAPPSAVVAPASERVAEAVPDAEALRRSWLAGSPSQWFPGDGNIPHEARSAWAWSVVTRLVCGGRVTAALDPEFFYLDLSRAPGEGGVHCRGPAERCLRGKLEAIEGLRGAAACHEGDSLSMSAGGQSCREVGDVLECDDSFRFMTDDMYLIRLDVRTRCPSNFAEASCTIVRAVVLSVPVE